METNSSPSSAVLALLHSCFNTHRSICILFVAPYLRLPIYGLGPTNMPRHHPWPSLPTDLHNRSYDRVLRLTWPLITPFPELQGAAAALWSHQSPLNNNKKKNKMHQSTQTRTGRIRYALNGKTEPLYQTNAERLNLFFFFFP